MTTPTESTAFAPDAGPDSVRHATEFTYLPDDAVPGEPDAFLFSVKVAWRGPGSWAVLWMGQCLGPEGWDFEPGSDGRTEEYLAAHRFPFAEAEELARKTVNTLSINGRSWAELKAFRAARAGS